jgi:hypothetical protein
MQGIIEQLHITTDVYEEEKLNKHQAIHFRWCSPGISDVKVNEKTVTNTLNST